MSNTKTSKNLLKVIIVVKDIQLTSKVYPSSYYLLNIIKKIIFVRFV